MLKILAPSKSPQVAWSYGLLGQLEWHCFQELVGRLLQRAGYFPEVAWIRPDGAAAFTVVHPARPQQLEAVVQCAPWQPAETGVAALQELHQAVQSVGAQRGIFVTARGFLQESRAFAGPMRLELVDGIDLLGTLQQMPDGERAAWLRMTTQGLYQTPTCPTCCRKMKQVVDPAAMQNQRECDLVYKSPRMESGEIHCRSLTLRRRAEVVFMKNVTTSAMTVHGQATGHLVIHGRLHIAAGGCVRGVVSARAIQLDPGGTMEAEARILKEAEPPPVPPASVPMVWRCPAYPKCRATLPAG